MATKLPTKAVIKKSETNPVQKKFVLQLTQEEAQQLDTILGEIPAKFANPLFNFFNQISAKRLQENRPPKSDPGTDTKA